MTALFRCLRRLSRSDNGATTIEYALIAAIIASSLIGGTQVLSKRVEKNFKCADNVLTAKFRDDGLGPCAPFEKTPPPIRERRVS